MNTIALRLYGADDIRLETFTLPEVGADEVLMRVVSDTVCASTYKAVKLGTGHKRVPKNVAENPIIIGHEMCGEVISVGAGYALAMYGGSIVAVSLRRAKERILYEEIMRSLSVGVVPVQRMFFAEELTLSMEEYELLESYAEEFAALGFEIEYRGEGSISVSGRPAVIDIATPLDELLYELLNNISLGDAPVEQQRTAMAELMAERGSRSFGQGLNSVNAAELLHTLEKCANPSFAPSGNPIMAEITLDEIRSKLTKK